MGVLNWFSGAIGPISDVIDAVHTSDEERLKLDLAFKKVQAELSGKLIELESQLLAAQASVIVAEAQGGSWLQRNWRPITMLTFLILIVADTFGFTEYRLSEQSWGLLKIGLGGYVVGRSVEKVAPVVAKAVSAK